MNLYLAEYFNLSKNRKLQNTSILAKDLKGNKEFTF